MQHTLAPAPLSNGIHPMLTSHIMFYAWPLYARPHPTPPPHRRNRNLVNASDVVSSVAASFPTALVEYRKTTDVMSFCDQMRLMQGERGPGCDGQGAGARVAMRRAQPRHHACCCCSAVRFTALRLGWCPHGPISGAGTIAAPWVTLLRKPHATELLVPREW